ncbi:MAG: DUF4402 domain-containing protein [Bacteroidia bacterium]|nr:DUF4402 domain-containing protein [Bacteroidia bacterium]
MAGENQIEMTVNQIPKCLRLLLVATIIFFFYAKSFAQPGLPARSITITATQGIHFGTFCLTGSSGGTVTVGYDGRRTSTGDISLLSIAPMAKVAIFEIKLCQGRNVSITFNATATLTGSNGGSMTLDIGPTEKGGNNASFPTNYDCNFITPLRMGGTLHIPGTALPGSYSGYFDMTFNQE